LLLLKRKYKLDSGLYSRIKKALKYGIKKTDEDRIKFLLDLPMNLRIDLSVIMHKDLVADIAFFKVFLNWILLFTLFKRTNPIDS